MTCRSPVPGPTPREGRPPSYGRRRKPVRPGPAWCCTCFLTAVALGWLAPLLLAVLRVAAGPIRRPPRSDTSPGRRSPVRSTTTSRRGPAPRWGKYFRNTPLQSPYRLYSPCLFLAVLRRVRVVPVFTIPLRKTLLVLFHGLATCYPPPGHGDAAVHGLHEDPAAGSGCPVRTVCTTRTSGSSPSTWPFQTGFPCVFVLYKLQCGTITDRAHRGRGWLTVRGVWRQYSGR